MLVTGRRRSSTGLLGNSEDEQRGAKRKVVLSAFGWVAYLAFCILLFWFYEICLSIVQQREGRYVAPYERNHKYVEKGVKWTLKHADKGRKKVWKGLKADATMKQLHTPTTPHPRPIAPHSHPKNSPYNLTAHSWEEYEGRLTRFSEMNFNRKLARWSREVFEDRLEGAQRNGKAGIPRQLWQSSSHQSQTMERSCQLRNPKSAYYFLDELAIETWMKQHFMGASMMQTWRTMEDNSIIKNIFWRQLVLFVEGGYYADSRAICVSKIEAWAGESKASVRPVAIFGFSEDVTSDRPIHINPWAFAGEPGHPIFLDAARRMTDHVAQLRAGTLNQIHEARGLMEKVMVPSMKLKDRQRAMKKAETWAKIKELLTQNAFALSDLTVEKGVLTDAVLSYVHCAYGFHWESLRNAQEPVQIGDVLFIPHHRMEALISKSPRHVSNM